MRVYSSYFAQRMEELQPAEVTLVFGYDHTVMRIRHGGQ